MRVRACVCVCVRVRVRACARACARARVGVYMRACVRNYVFHRKMITMKTIQKNKVKLTEKLETK